MNDEKLIVSLSRENAKLKELIDELRASSSEIKKERDNYRGYLQEISQKLGYSGHYGNIVNVVSREH